MGDLLQALTNARSYDVIDAARQRSGAEEYELRLEFAAKGRQTPTR